ncbi:DUF7695 domain-containing protein [Mammaliicoccus sciuri]|uniref:DUF7695 domain-containing protein n=1 Tax=Mammaliicoccus sciuri TaxID=1296 RepID=UPI003BF86D9B
MKKIIRNIAKCKICDDVIESKHTHDYVMCKCDVIFLDGGQRKQRGKVEMK